MVYFVTLQQSQICFLHRCGVSCHEYLIRLCAVQFCFNVACVYSISRAYRHLYRRRASFIASLPHVIGLRGKCQYQFIYISNRLMNHSPLSCILIHTHACASILTNSVICEIPTVIVIASE